MHTDTGSFPCPVCGAPMVRVTSHDQCGRCGFILPCCDGDAVICASEETGEAAQESPSRPLAGESKRQPA